MVYTSFVLAPELFPAKLNPELASGFSRCSAFRGRNVEIEFKPLQRLSHVIAFFRCFTKNDSPIGFSGSGFLVAGICQSCQCLSTKEER